MSARPPSGSRIAWHRLPVLVAVLAIALLVLGLSQALLRADMASQGARRLVTHWASRASSLPSAGEIAQAEAALRRAVDITPANAELHELLGDLRMVAARVADAAQDDVARDAAQAAAVAHYQAALARRPSDPQTWAGLAAALQATGDLAATHAAWARSLALGPNEGHVQPMLLDVALRGWADATPGMQSWATALFAASAAPQQVAINKLAALHGLRFESDEPQGTSTGEMSRTSP
ncbi:MAG: hypothetical protein ACK4PH_03005 [Aquincola tertiaricarbonis]